MLSACVCVCVLVLSACVSWCACVRLCVLVCVLVYVLVKCKPCMVCGSGFLRSILAEALVGFGAQAARHVVLILAAVLILTAGCGAEHSERWELVAEPLGVAEPLEVAEPLVAERWAFVVAERWAPSAVAAAEPSRRSRVLHMADEQAGFPARRPRQLPGMPKRGGVSGLRREASRTEHLRPPKQVDFPDHPWPPMSCCLLHAH